MIAGLIRWSIVNRFLVLLATLMISASVKSVDPDAKVDVDLNSKKVKIESTENRASIAGALTEAGYPPAA